MVNNRGYKRPTPLPVIGTKRVLRSLPTSGLVLVAMVAFAANSVLCRLALGTGLIDAASFTSTRLVSGSLCLLTIVMWRDPAWRPANPNWPAVLALFAYMACFSFAYESLSAGTGALLLFGFVQLTMILTSLTKGARLTGGKWLGLALATGGLVYLVSPGVAAPALGYAVLMAIAGVAWGTYSLLGVGGSEPTYATTNNFVYATPLALLFSLAFGLTNTASTHISLPGVLLGIASGALASGLGYAIWYSALKHIKATTAAVVQLSVPAITAVGGVLFIAEPLSLRLVLATGLILGGIGLFLKAPNIETSNQTASPTTVPPRDGK